MPNKRAWFALDRTDPAITHDRGKPWLFQYRFLELKVPSERAILLAALWWPEFEIGAHGSIRNHRTYLHITGEVALGWANVRLYLRVPNLRGIRAIRRGQIW